MSIWQATDKILSLFIFNLFNLIFALEMFEKYVTWNLIKYEYEKNIGELFFNYNYQNTDQSSIKSNSQLQIGHVKNFKKDEEKLKWKMKWLTRIIIVISSMVQFLSK